MTSKAAWKRRVVKKMLHRVDQFVEASETVEERQAWLRVRGWFRDILEQRGFLTRHGSIGLWGDPEEVELR